MNFRRQRALAALLCAVGAGLVLLAAGRTWATVTGEGAITPVSQRLSGSELGAATGALGWAALASLAALLATRGRVRAGVGLLLVLGGGGIAFLSLQAVRRPNVVETAREASSLLAVGARVTVDGSAWWAVSVAGGVLLVAAGALTLARGSRWPGMSARYDRSGGAGAPAEAAGAAADPAGLWRSLDRGEDPTT